MTLRPGLCLVLAAGVVATAYLAGGVVAETAAQAPGDPAPPGHVQRFASVLDDDQPVLGLGVEDFRIEEDGQRREILRVEPASMPMHVALLVDAGMAATSNIAHIREALTNFVLAMRGHQVALYSFANQRRTVVPFTRRLERLTEATQTFTGFSESSTYLLDALLQTGSDLEQQNPVRPTIVVLTGQDRGTADLAIRGNRLDNNRLTPDAARDRSADEVVKLLAQSRITVNAVVTRQIDITSGFTDSRSDGLGTVTSGAGAFRWMQENREREQVIDQAPTATGGRLYKLSSTSGIEERFVRIARELLNQYLVTYYRPMELDPPRDIDVETTDDNLTIRSVASRVYIPYVSPTVYVADGTVVEPEMVYHHSPECPGFGVGGGQSSVSVSLDALGPNGTYCPYCPERSEAQ